MVSAPAAEGWAAPLFPRSEYERRWRRVREAAAARDLAGVVVFSRGGAQTDSYADVFYLANHYTVFPLLPDAAPHWSGHSHCALIVPAAGEPVLVLDFDELRPDLVPVDDVVVSGDVPAAVAGVLRDRGLEGEAVGLVGANALQVAPYLRLRELSPRTELVVCDGLVEDLRVVKTAAEQDRLRAATRVGELVVAAMLEAAGRGGRTEADAVAEGYALAARHGVAMYDAAVSSGPNSGRYAYGRLPSWSLRELEPGDLFHVDCYGALDGYLFDLSRTAIVASRPSGDQRELLDGAIAAIGAGLEAVRPGASGAELFAVVRGELDRRGLSGAAGEGEEAVGFSGYDCHGHGFGLAWEWPWITPWEERRVEAGMVIAVECMAGRPASGSVKLEQAVLVGEDANELLYELPPYHVDADA